MHVHGSGFIAKNFKRIKLIKLKKVVIYAAGVSNSKSKDKKKFLKERKKIQIFLNNHNTEYLFIYISTTSVLDNYEKKNKYTRNKIIIENLIKKSLNNFLILRLPQIVGKSKNPHTLTNFIYRKILSEQRFKVWSNVKRNLIDIDDLIKIVKQIISTKLKHGNVINILNPNSIYVREIVNIMGKIVKKNPKYILLEYKPKKKGNLKIQSSSKFNLNIKKYFKDKNYFKKILEKYYR
jgi:nucleoside-diphosphate-sugar epimerase